MWSLPDLARLNSEAATHRKRFERAVRTGRLDGKKISCEHAADDGENCSGSISCELWFDIFSDDPKGILVQCEYHRGQCGVPEEYFYCSDCGRTMVTHYTWERYNTIVDDEELCLPCACKRYTADPDNLAAAEPSDHRSLRLRPHAPGAPRDRRRDAGS